MIDCANYFGDWINFRVIKETIKPSLSHIFDGSDLAGITPINFTWGGFGFFLTSLYFETINNFL